MPTTKWCSRHSCRSCRATHAPSRASRLGQISSTSAFSIRMVPGTRSTKVTSSISCARPLRWLGRTALWSSSNNGRYQPTEGYGTITSPGNDPYVITVGATKPEETPTRVDDLMASYSSKGPTALVAVAKQDLVPPGKILVSLEAPGSTLYNEYPGNRGFWPRKDFF